MGTNRHIVKSWLVEADLSEKAETLFPHLNLFCLFFSQPPDF